MPLRNGKYVSPTWHNGGPPALNAAELQALTDTVEKTYTKPETLSDATKAALGLPNTAVPDDIFSMLQFRNPTTTVPTQFGMGGHFKDGKFSGLYNLIGAPLDLYNLYNYYYHAVNTSVQNEQVFCFEGSNRINLVRLKYTGSGLSIVGVPFILHDKNEAASAICETNIPEQYAVCYKNWEFWETALRDSQVQMVKWDGTRFINIGSPFIFSAVQCDWSGIVYSGTQDEYVILFGSNSDSIAFAQRVKWSGTSFANIGSKFAISATKYRSKHIVKSDDINEYVITLTDFDAPYKLNVQRIKWDGTTFVNLGTLFTFPQSDSIGADVIHSSTKETFIACFKKTNEIYMQRFKWSPSGFSNVGGSFLVYANSRESFSSESPACILGFDNESYYVTTREYNANPNTDRAICIRNVVWRDGNFENVGKKTTLIDNAELEGFLIIKSNVENTYGLFYQPNGTTSLAAYALSAYRKNATALQERNPNQKVLVVKE